MMMVMTMADDPTCLLLVINVSFVGNLLIYGVLC